MQTRPHNSDSERRQLANSPPRHQDSHAMNAKQQAALEAVLQKFDGLPLECDGMTRVVSMYLTHEEIPHTIQCGKLAVQGAGFIPLHYWVAFADGRVCDLRARMWLGNAANVPHGLFLPNDDQMYTKAAEFRSTPYLEVLFYILALAPLEHFLQDESTKT